MQTKIIIDIDDANGYMHVVIFSGDKIYTSHVVEKKLLPKNLSKFVDKLLKETDKMIPVVIDCLIKGGE